MVSAVNQISSELIRWHIPLVPICIILPMLVGIVSGITIAFVGTTFPVIFALLAAALVYFAILYYIGS